MSVTTGQLEFTSSSTSSTFLWKIENFSTKCSKVGESIVSPIFESGDCNNKTYPQWKLVLYPFGERCKDYVSVYLWFLSQPMLEEYVGSYAIFIHDGTQIDISTRHCSKIEKFTIDDCMWGWDKFIKRSDLLKKQTTLLKQDTLIISCSIYNDSSKTESHCLHSSLVDKYESIYLLGDFSDVTIVVDDKKINAHKAILSARSKVFSAMFKNNMAEAKTNLVKISDIEYTVMNKFLLFLYSGKVDDIKKFAKSLLPVANKYDVDDLKSLCEATLLNSLAIDNACEFLSIADLYNCAKLKRVAINFITSQMKEIIKTKGFEDLSSSNQALFKEIFCKVVEKKY